MIMKVKYHRNFSPLFDLAYWKLSNKTIYISEKLKGSEREKMLLFHEQIEVNKFLELANNNIINEQLKFEKEFFENPYRAFVLSNEHREIFNEAHIFALKAEKKRFPELFLKYKGDLNV